MKKMLDSLVLSLSMFTTCPLPRRDYDAESLSYMMAFFPVAGLYVSLVAAATYYLSGLLPISTVLRAALLLIAICVATGGIHLDGFSDASDALFSRRDVNKMLEIMHDVHIGAFAVISLVLVLLLQFAALQSLIATAELRIINAVFILPILSRSLSGLYSLSLPSARSDGMHHDYRQNSSGTVRLILLVFLLISAMGLLISAHYSGLIVLSLTLLTTYLFARFSLKRFKGATGDLAGFLLVMVETIALLSLALSHDLPAWF